MILQLNPPLPFETPKGSGFAHFLIDNGIEHQNVWIVFLNDTGECWCFENPDIRMSHNLTIGRQKQDYIWRSKWNK